MGEPGLIPLVIQGGNQRLDISSLLLRRAWRHWSFFANASGTTWWRLAKSRRLDCHRRRV